MKILVYADELYPSFGFYEPDENDDETADARIVDVPEEVVERWKRIEAEDEAMQKELAELLAAAGGTW